MKILALDLGKFKTVACLYEQSPDQPHHWDFVTVDTLKKDFARLIQQFQADVLVFETCTAAGWLTCVTNLISRSSSPTPTEKHGGGPKSNAKRIVTTPSNWLDSRR